MSFIQTIQTGLTRSEAEALAARRRKQNRIVGVYHDGNAWCVEETPVYK